MSKLDLLLSRFEGVKKSGNQYLCKCPAHEDRTASLAITEKEHDHLYLNCFAGCETLEILMAVGLDWDALFPDKDKSKTSKPSIPIKEAALVLELQSWIVYQYANAIAMGEDPDRGKLYDAVMKIADIGNLLGNHRR
jgi:hypothetical protein